ncbi:type IV secretion system protein VirB8 [Wolbachia pipientis]|uniref:Type IV secretion system protein VirB8 n=1 Tax=Wolbachia pipientis TaxID=955 RepID=A0A1E7QK50_WOLPI|nr:type IV secretion system protein [Wolbachia pipientis]OEY86823.1 type IV secretion system protein VirB8 [Wolbachia pipientis]
MFKFFNRSKNTKVQDIDWSTSRYSTVVAQRNVLLVLALLLLISITISVLVVFKISTSRTVEPFVIEIEKKSGMVHVVDPATVLQYSANDTLNRYFITDYIKTRECFDPYNYIFNYYKKIRLLSSINVANEFYSYTRSQDLDRLVSQHLEYIKTEFKVNSIQKINNDTVQVLFAIKYERKDGSHIKKSKIVTMSYRFAQLELNDQDRYINPLGFQVTSYRLDNYRE